MKSKNYLVKQCNWLAAILLFIFSVQINAQNTCINFGNGLSCQASVDVQIDCIQCTGLTVCTTTGVQTVAWLGGASLCCSGCTGGTCDMIITISAINGCAISPVSISRSWASGQPGGIGKVSISCTAGCIPAACCDNGTILYLDTNVPVPPVPMSAWIN